MKPYVAPKEEEVPANSTTNNTETNSTTNSTAEPEINDIITNLRKLLHLASVPGKEDTATYNMIATELKKLKMTDEKDKKRLRELELEFVKKLITVDIQDSYSKALLLKSIGLVALKYKPFFTVLQDVLD